MRIVWRNVGDEAEVTATPDCVATLPVTNLQNIYREKLARWTELDNQNITAIWTSAVAVNCVVLYRNNFGPNATWRVRLYSDATLTDTLYDSTPTYCSAPVELGDLDWGVDPLGLTLYTDWDYGVCSLWFDGVFARAMTIDIADTENPVGYGQASRLFVGNYFEPQIGPSLGAGMAWEENTKQTRTEGGSLRTEPGANWRTCSVDMDHISEHDRKQFSEMARQIGMRGDVFISRYPGLLNEQERDYQMQAKLTSLAPIISPYPTEHKQTLTFGEI